MVDITASDFTKGRYNLIIYVGIDIAKLNHFASAISSKLFKLTNGCDGFQLPNSRLIELSYEDANNIIGLESAHYGVNLVRYLVACNYNMCMLNPIMTSVMRKDNIARPRLKSRHIHHCQNTHGAGLL